MEPATEDKSVVDGTYTLLGVLGQGGTGVVYDAVAPDGTAIALKVMHAELAGDRQIRGRFQREAAILRRLEGEHVCPIVAFGEVPGEVPGTTLLYIALPKIEGTSLEQLLENGPVDVDRALDILLEVLDALRSAHAQGIIHRDLKPANVLLERRAHGERVVVVDFGMSKIITGTGIGTTNLTTHNMVFGTPEYMSPEQARGEDLDERCDVYAAGVILYEMLTGTPPFTGETPLTVLTAHLTSELEPPSTRPGANGRVTPALEAVVMRALAREREERYPSAAAFAAAIRHARVAPDDVRSIRAEVSSKADAFAVTLPSTVPIDHMDATSPTRTNHAASPSSMAPSSAARPLAPQPPPSARPLRIASSLPPPEPVTRTWILVWIVVGLVSVALGIWIALRRG